MSLIDDIIADEIWMTGGRKMGRFISLVLLAPLAACASPNMNYRPHSLAISEPPLGTTATARIGDTLVKQGRFTSAQAIKVESDVKLGALANYTIGAGYYSKVGEDRVSDYYLPEQGAEGGSVRTGMLSDPVKSVQAYKSGEKLCIVTMFNVHSCSSRAVFTRVDRPSSTADSFQQALIYSGRVGDKLKIGYREFSNSLARPAFNNEVEYDLSTSNIVGYRGARLEVLEATNELIRYRLLANFNEAQQ